MRLEQDENENMNAPSQSSSDTHSSAMMEATKKSISVAEKQGNRGTGWISTINLALVFVTIHVLGIVFGFILFYVTFRTECAHKLSLLVNQSDASIAHQRSCVEERTALTVKHQDCLVSYDNALSRIITLQEQEVVSKSTIHNATADIKQLQMSLAQCETNIQESVQNSEKLRIRLQNQLDLAKAMMREKVDEVERLKTFMDDESSDQCGEVTHTNLDEAMIQLQADIRRRSEALAMHTFGPPPYTVLFVVNKSKKSLSTMSFEIELSTLHEMPHTVYTFLSLVDAGLYLGTSLQAKPNSIMMVGGSPSSSSQKQVQSKLLRQYAEFGFNAVSPLLFTERSTQPCGPRGFGFRNRGPEVELCLLENEVDSSANPYTCPGKIVSGFESLVQYTSQDAARKEPLSIVDVRIVAGVDHAVS